MKYERVTSPTRFNLNTSKKERVVESVNENSVVQLSSPTSKSPFHLNFISKSQIKALMLINIHGRKITSKALS